MENLFARMRLLATDVDGTIASSDHRVAPRTAQALRRVQEAGVPVVLVTGRSAPGTEALWREIGLKAPVISCGGSLIRRPDTGEVILERRMDTGALHELLQLGQELGALVSLWTTTRCYCTIHPLSGLMELMNGVPFVFDADMAPYVCPEVVRAVLGVEAERMAEVEPLIQARFAGRFTATRGTPNFIDITDAGANKGVALARLAEYLGVPREGVVAIGDGNNDVEMLDYAGLGIAMGNGSEAARRAARMQIGRNDEYGVAIFLESVQQERA